MSLVAYGSSDESSDEEVISKEESVEQFSKITEVKQIPKSSEITQITEKQTSPPISVQVPFDLSTNEARSRINLPFPKSIQQEDLDEDKSPSAPNVYNNGTLNFNFLPQPKHTEILDSTIEDDDFIPPPKITYDQIEKPEKKEKGPVKISVPSLSDFKDLDQEKEAKARIKPSQKGTGLFSVLPPPKSETLLKSKTMVPHIISKKSEDPKPVSIPQQKNTGELKKINAMHAKKPQKSMISANYDSNSDDEDNSHVSKTDFFSLSTNDDIPIPAIPISDIVNETLKHSNRKFSKTDNYSMEISTNEEQQPEIQIPDKTLVSNVINLPKEEIIQKNKAEVGPKLPVPEQDYNIDSTGNLVFDEKAIEYLCGKRGVKRNNKELQDVDIIDINGEDIKPDEREWMVKALTEEPVTRPMSQGAGPSGQSKKKHQITYLAHQAKAMEVELKNQWAQNKLTRQQTQSKYGF